MWVIYCHKESKTWNEVTDTRGTLLCKDLELSLSGARIKLMRTNIQTFHSKYLPSSQHIFPHSLIWLGGCGMLCVCFWVIYRSIYSMCYTKRVLRLHGDSTAPDQLTNLQSLTLGLHCLLISQRNPISQIIRQCSSQIRLGGHASWSELHCPHMVPYNSHQGRSWIYHPQMEDQNHAVMF